MTRADIPNIISVLRILLVLPTVAALANEMFGLALLLFAVAGVSDALDGYIAKRFHYESRLGTILDPLADKLLLVATYLVLAWLGLLPWWLTGAVVARDLLILAGAASFHLLIGEYEMEPTAISKLNTVAQIVLGLAVVLSAGVHALPEAALDWLVLLVLVTTVTSGIDYVWTWSVRAWRARRG
ncbi:MAG: CDP-alcohol phosphatidyltransferase family protein [Gammaproteobacteria bacterium]|nr:CDP-alcohol phosphatidyltransferase family protein [Gammaproteobacteria bacterium]